MSSRHRRQQCTRYPRRSRQSLASIGVLLVVILLPQASAGVFGRRSTTAAIFGNLLGNRDAAETVPPQSAIAPPPPPPPPRGDPGADPSDALDQPPYDSAMRYNNLQPGDGYPPPPPPPLFHHDGSSFSTDDVVYSFQQREEIHLRQLDVLTERIMQLEAATASERNIILEWQQNCTTLMAQVSSLEDGMQEERRKCQAFEEQRTLAVAEQERLKEELKVALREAEDLAALIEKHRLLVEEEEESFRKKKTKKRRGFLAWLFGWDSDNGDGMEDAYEEARSTLLKALQTERNSVDELESAVASLQQNNSAIAQQVQSRDSIIDELSDRIAIFEDDKIVLKAALKQLQKEIKEEAPKTQKLAEDYKTAQKEIQRLQQHIDELVLAHQQEISKLEKQSAQKQDEIREAQGNLTEIGSYVDKLESRLADFSVARREIEKREEQCRELETRSKEAMQERDELKVLLAEYETEREEHKQLLQELVSERTSLKSHTNENELEQNAMRLRGSLAKLEIDYKALDKLNRELQLRIHELERREKESEESSRVVDESLEAAEARLSALQATLDEQSREKEDLATKYEEAENQRSGLLKQIDQLTVVISSESSKMEDTIEGLESSLRQATDEVASLKEELATVQNDLDKTSTELEAAQEQTRRLEDSLRAGLPSKLVDDAPLSKAISNMNEYDGLETEPQVHMSVKTLLPNVLPLPCKSQTLAEATLVKTSTTVLIPYQSLGRRPISPVIKRHAQRQLQVKPAVSRASVQKGPDPKTRQSPHSEQNRSSSLIAGAMSVTPQTLPVPRALTLGTGSTNGTVNATRAYPFGGGSVNATTGTRKPVRKVPFREMRKFFAKTTGIHGLFTKPSSTDPKVTGRQQIAPAKAGAKVVGPVQNDLSDAAKMERAKRFGVHHLPRQQATKTSNAPGANHMSTSSSQSASRVGYPPRIPETQAAPRSTSSSTSDASTANQSISGKRSFGGGLMQPPPGKDSLSDATFPKASNDRR